MKARITDVFQGLAQSWVQEVDPNLLQRWRRNGKRFVTNADGTVTVTEPEHTTTYEFLSEEK